MQPFPTNFPSDEVGIIVQKIRRPTEVGNRQAANAGWWVLGYGLGQILPDQVITTSEVLGPEALADLLTQQNIQAVAVPWGLVVPALLKLLELWLRSLE